MICLENPQEVNPIKFHLEFDNDKMVLTPVNPVCIDGYKYL